MKGIEEDRRTRMLNKISYYILCSIILIVWSTQISNAATNCEQSFTFLLATSGQEPVFWIIVDVSGECWDSRLIQIVLENTKDTAIYSSLGYPGDWNWRWLRERIKGVVCQPAIELKNQNGLWGIPGLPWYIKDPPPDSTLFRLFQEEYNVGRERSWNMIFGLKGISLPSLEGIDVKLVYYYPRGVYIGYTLSKAYYFPQSGYILVFINQPRMASGLDTMHGFLLLKIAKESEN
jgi:hypothetical protein